MDNDFWRLFVTVGTVIVACLLVLWGTLYVSRDARRSPTQNPRITPNQHDHADDVEAPSATPDAEDDDDEEYVRIPKSNWKRLTTLIYLNLAVSAIALLLKMLDFLN